jgi:hypothetical protein
MDPGLRTPLVDFFRRGEVSSDIRMLAARGGLAPRAHEQLALLILLSNDSDPSIADAAAGTLNRLPTASLSAFLARSDVPGEYVEFFAGRGIQPSSPPAPTADQPLLADDDETPDAIGDDRVGVLQQISQMTVSQRVTCAMKGGKEARAILVRDPNRLVAVAVLSSPKLSETEVESFSRMPTVSEDVLRIISGNRVWMRNYGITTGLVRNPKTPIPVSMPLLSRLSERDLRMLSTDRNVPEPLRIAARKRVVVNR